jgi:hypothetical protein
MSNTLLQGLNDPTPPPTPVITTPDLTAFCEGGSAELTSSSATGNTWSNGETTQSIVATASGNYAVTVTNTGGCSATSTATVITVFPHPQAVFGTIADMCIYSSPITLTQGSPAGGIYAGNGVGGGQFDPAAAGLGTSTVSYYYTDANGCQDTVQTTILVDDCAGLEDYEATGIQVFPNPSAGVFTIDAGTGIISSVSVFDHAGRLVTVLNGLNTPNASADLTHVAVGVYTLQIVTNGGTHRVPVIVSK